MRIVSVYPAATDILLALGLGAELVAVSERCDLPEGLGSLPRLAGFAGVAPGRLVDLEPDLVILGGDGGNAASAEARRILQVAQPEAELLVLAPASVEGVFNAISTVGAMTEAEDAAMDVVERLRERLRAVQEIVMGRRDHGFQPARVVALDGLVPPRAVGRWVPDQVRLAGGWELLGRTGGSPGPTTWEAVRDVDPEILVLMPEELGLGTALATWDRVSRPEGWTGIRAVAGGRVFVVDGVPFSRPGPRVVDGIETLAELIDPAAFDGMAPPASWAKAR